MDTVTVSAARHTREPLTAPSDRGRLRVMTIYLATDMYLAARQRDGCSPKTIDRYRRILHKLGDMYPHIDVDELTYVMVSRCVDQWATAAPSTSAQIISILHTFFDWCHDEGLIPADPSSRLKRPKLKRYDDRDDIVSISTADAQKILAAAKDWRERIALHILAYTGSRRHAVAQLRLRDYDPVEGTLTFREKGSKTIRKPVATPLRDLLDAAEAAGIYDSTDDYLIPSQAPQRRNGDRDDRFLLRLVQEVAARVGIEAHVHAFRAAFAVYFLEHKPDQLVALQLLLGHASPETTRHYLRRLDRQRMMGEVRDLDWGGPAETVFEVSAVTEKEGFEPSFEALADGQPVDTPREDILGALLRRVKPEPVGVLFGLFESGDPEATG